MNRPSPGELSSIDHAVSAWRQGDVAFPDDLVFVHLADLGRPITPQACALAVDADPGVENVATAVEGVVILTQTCDIIKPCGEWPFVEVAPLVRVDEKHLGEIKKGWRPSYAWIPSISNESRLVASLDLTMTVEKAVLSNWTRIQGCLSDEDQREFADALARKRARRAFPNDFNKAVGKLQQRIKDKHNKDSDEGRVLRALREIRVRSWPEWNADEVRIFMWFIKQKDPPDLGNLWYECATKWYALIDWTKRFENDGFLICDLEDITGREYLDSDRLDLDYLSTQDHNSI